MQARRHGRTIRNLGQRDLLRSRVPDRALLRLAGLNSKRLLARWKSGDEVPTAERRLRLEEELGIPQVAWLVPATDRDQQDAVGAPPPEEVAEVTTEEPSRYAHVPWPCLWHYALGQDIAVYGQKNAVRLELKRPLVTSERPSTPQVAANLSTLESWLVQQKRRQPGGDDGKRAPYQATLDRFLGRREFLPGELRALDVTAAGVEALRPDPALASFLGLDGA